MAEKKDDRIEELKDQLMVETLTPQQVTAIKDKIQFLQSLEK